MPSLQIVSKVVGKKLTQAPELKRGIPKPKCKSESDSGNTKSNSVDTPLKVGTKVKFPLSNKTAHGTLRYIGPTKFSSGLWCGIELSRPDGRNNGTVKGVKYFQCRFNYGIFVHAEKVTIVEEASADSKQGKSSGSTPKKKSQSESLKDEELKVKQLHNTSVDDEWVVYGSEQPSFKQECIKSKKQEEESCGTAQEDNNPPLNQVTENKQQNLHLSAHENGSSLDDENNDMKAIIAAEVEVENSPLTIKIAKSVGEDDNNNHVENAAKSEFEDGLLFYVTAHQIAAPISPRDLHKSCPILSSSSSDEDVFADENKSNTWPKYPKDEVQKAQDGRSRNGPTNLRRRLSGIEKRIRLSHFRTPSPGTLRRSLSQSAVYPKENYVAYEEDGVNRPRFPVSLKRSVSDVTAYNTSDSFVKKIENSPKPVRKSWLRREKTAPDSFGKEVAYKSSDDDKSSEADHEQFVRLNSIEKHDTEDHKSKEINSGALDEDNVTDIDDNDIATNFVVIDDVSRDNEKGGDKPSDVVDDGGESLNNATLVDEDLVIIDTVNFEESAPDSKALGSEQYREKELVINEKTAGSPVLRKEAKAKPSIEKSETLQKNSPGQQGSGLPIFVKAHPTKPAIQNKSHSKITTRKLSVPAVTGKKETPAGLRPMSKRISHSQAELSSKTETPNSRIDEKGRLPKKLNKRVSDLVANFERPKDGHAQQKVNKTGVTRPYVVKTDDKEKKWSSSGKNREAANEKESRKTSVTVTSRKPSQVSQEELDGKETLSKQYLKEDGGKKVGLINKAGTDGSQAGPKSNIATPVGRSGILGYGKRNQKTTVETPKRSIASLKNSTSRQEKQNDVQHISSGKEKCLPAKSKDVQSSSKDQEKIKELKNKCLDCEKQISDLKNGLNEKNLAMEAFIIVIKQHIKTIEQQSEKQVQLQQRNKQLDIELKHQTKLAVSNGERCEDLERRFDDLSGDFSKQIETLYEEHELEREILKKEFIEKHETEMGQANTKFDKEISKLKDYHDDKISKLQAEHETVLNNLKDDFEKTINFKDEDFSKTKDDITNRFQKEKEEICLEYEERLQDLKNQLASSEQQCRDFETKAKELQFELDKDLESKIQGALAKYKDLPAELESLQAVVEMKNEDIRKTRTHNMELQKRLEDFYELEKKYIKLSQEKEAIDAALENKVKCERQLSVEKESLQANLEKEARKVKRLSMEKEELMWKFSNSSSSLSLSSPSLNVDLPTTPNGFQSTPNTSRSFNRSLKTQSLYLPPLDDEDYTVL